MDLVKALNSMNSKPRTARSTDYIIKRLKYLLLFPSFIFMPFPGGAQGMDHVKEMVQSLPVILKNSFIELRSDDPSIDSRAILAQIEDAYNFDRRIQGLHDVAILDQPLIVGLATDERIKEYVHTTMGGRAVGTTMFAAHVNLFRERPDFACFLAAHELEHVQMSRLRAIEPEIPVYIFEGIACSLGDRFAFQVSNSSTYLTNAKSKLSSYTADNAADVIANFRVPSEIATFRSSGKLYQAEHLGGLFIEFLRVRKASRSEEFFRKCGSMWQDVGQGSSFLSSFERSFGLTLESAEQQFIAFMKETENKSDVRFRNTIYQEIAAKAK